MTVVVGSAEIIVKANTKAFAAEVESTTKPAFAEVEREAGAAGEKSGVAMAAGVRKGTAAIAAESKAAGAAAGAGMARPVEDGAKRSEVAMVAAAGRGHKAFLGATAAIVGTAAEGLHLAESMQTTDAAIAGAAGTSVAAAKRVGDALLGTAGKSEFSGSVQAKAYATVAGQLKTVEGRALTAAKAEQFMHAAGELAVAKQIDLGVAVSTTASVMQAFQLKTKDAAHVTDVLYQASNATGVGVDVLGGQLTKLRSKLGDTGGSLGDVAGLLVDMTEHGVTGRAALSGVTSGLTTLQKTAGAVTNAQKAQDDAFSQMPPTLQKLARSYQNGEISQAQFNKATKVLTPEQKQLVTAFNSADGALEKASAKYKGLGIEVFDAHGKFVGMDRIIGQLGPKFQHMSQQQQIATATTLFGAGAAKQMVAVINAGPAAYDKATASVSKHGAAQSAAAKQSHTMHGELKTLGATVSDVATEFGQVLVPAATSVIHVVGQGTHFLLQHKTAAEALAAVIGGVLSIAIGVFTVNKMGAMVKSVRAAGTELRGFAGVASSVAKTVAGKFGLQAAASEESAAKIEASQAAERTSVRSTATTVTATTGTIQAENAAAGRSFTMVGTSAGAGAARVEAEVAAEAGAVATADTAIEATNAAAAVSFSAMLGPIGAVLAGVVAIQQTLHPGGDMSTFLSNAKGKINAALARRDQAAVDPRLAGFPDGGATSGTSAPRVSATHINAAATSGLTPKQRKQLAAITSGGGGAGTGGGGGSHSAGRSVSVWSGLSKSEKAFAANFSNDTGLDPRVVSAWIRQEEGSRKHPLGHNDSNWLNVGFTDSGAVKGTKLAGWSDPVQAAKMTAEWMKGTGPMAKAWGPASAGIRRILSKAGTTSSAQIAAIMGSGWASGGEASLRALYDESGSSTRVSVGSPAKLTGHQVAVIDPTKWARSQIGHDAETGLNNHGKELDALQRQFGQTGQAWCAEFATTAAMMGGAHKAVRTAAVKTIAAEAQMGTHGYEKGIKKRGRAGDLVLLHGSDGHWGHVGFVESVNHKKGTFTSIEGNTNVGNGAVRRVVHRMSDSEGFARPEYASKYVAGNVAITKDVKALEKVNTTVAGQEAALNKWIAGQRATESVMTTAQKKALNEEIAIKRSALGIQTTREYAALTTQSKQQSAHLKQEGNDQKLASAMMTKLVTAQHSGNLKQLTAVLKQVHDAGFGGLIKRLGHDHVAGFDQLRKQLLAVHKAALDKQTKEQAAETNKAVIAFLQAMDQAAAAAISSQSQLDSDTASAQIQAIQDQTKVTLDQQAEVGKTGADLVAAQAQTALDTVTQTNDAAVAAAQLAVDKAAGGSETDKATAAANLAAAQSAAGLAEAQAQATLDLDTAAAQTADAATSAADAAQAAAGSSSTPLGGPGLPPNTTFQFTINGQHMTAADLFAEVGWALKTGQLPVAPGSPAVPA